MPFLLSCSGGFLCLDSIACSKILYGYSQVVVVPQIFLSGTIKPVFSLRFFSDLKYDLHSARDSLI